MLEMGTKQSANVMKIGKDEEHNKAVFLWFKQKCEGETNSDKADQLMTSLVPHSVAVFLWFKQKREGETNSDEVDQLMTSLVPHSVAVRMFDKCLKWLEEQEVSTYNTAILRDS